jgi:hypothetical protein
MLVRTLNLGAVGGMGRSPADAECSQALFYAVLCRHTSFAFHWEIGFEPALRHTKIGGRVS